MKIFFFQEFKNAYLEDVYEDIVSILEPVRTIWVRSSSLLPHMLTYQQNTLKSENINYDNSLSLIKSIISNIDKTIGKIAIDYIDHIQQKKTNRRKKVLEYRSRLISLAYQMTDLFCTLNIEQFPDILYNEVMRLER